MEKGLKQSRKYHARFICKEYYHVIPTDTELACFSLQRQCILDKFDLITLLIAFVSIGKNGLTNI